MLVIDIQEWYLLIKLKEKTLITKKQKFDVTQPVEQEHSLTKVL